MIRSCRPILLLLSLFGMLAMSSACSISKARQAAIDRDEAMSIDAQTDAVPVSADISTNMADLAKSPDADPESGESSAPSETKPDPAREPASASASTTATPAPAPTTAANKDDPDKGTPSPPPAALTNYTVKRGDTLMKISFSLYADLYRWKEIFELNRGKMSKGHELLSPGTRLRVYRPGTVVIRRNGEPYLIRQRDTLSKISNSVYGTSAKWRKIWKNNPQLIHDPNRIYAGFYLYYTLDRDERKARKLASESSSTTPAAVNPTGTATPTATAPESAVAPESSGAPAPETPAPAAARPPNPMVPPPTPPLSQFVGTPDPAPVAAPVPLTAAAPPTAPVSAK